MIDSDKKVFDMMEICKLHILDHFSIFTFGYLSDEERKYMNNNNLDILYNEVIV